MRAVVEFDMIHEGDRILVGVSGGKDSLFLLYALCLLRERIGRKFSLRALTIDPMFSADFDTAPIRDFCAELNVPFDTFKVDINGVINEQGGKNACFSCAYFRRGAINRHAKETNCNKVAYAHHNDDATETFLMGLLYSGQVSVFLPVTYLERTDITVIRPLLYFREKDIARCQKYHGVTPVASPCPRDGHTTRQEVKELIAALENKNREIYPHIAAAMRQSALGDLWPAAKDRDEMRPVYKEYMEKREEQDNDI